MSSSRDVGAAELRRQLVEIDSQRARVHAQIHDLQAELARLATQRQKIAISLRGVTSPITQLAPELMLEIFHQHVADLQDPLILTHVCREWRDLAVSESRLWTRISLGAATKSSPEADKLLHRRLQRAGDAPLHIETIDFSGCCTEPRIYSIITGHSQQIRSLQLELPLPEACSLDGLQGHISQLAELQMHVCENQEQVAFLQNAPALRQLVVSVVDFDSNEIFSNMTLPFAQITTLILTTPCREVLPLAEKMPFLETLEMYAWRHAFPVARPRAVFSHLRTLRCRKHPSGPPRTQLTWMLYLECPALEALEMDLRHASYSAYGENLTLFLSRSNRLRSLVLSNVSAFMVADIIAYTPTIESLSLPGLSGQGPLFGTLVTESVLPNLRELSIDPHSPFPEPVISMPSVLDFLAKRASTQSAFRRLIFGTSSTKSYGWWFSKAELVHTGDNLPRFEIYASRTRSTKGWVETRKAGLAFIFPAFFRVNFGTQAGAYYPLLYRGRHRVRGGGI
ncbi:F-box domain-containing protein [Mycena chlorophos]|uniref:F-box domain-containing protein n=1 Tax=Mycena chlorophos TaxID=658473 RepID=A0A8H6S6K4_MYCCL|nr:F-box domain-containing protein [Mycena chlorophos]